MELNFDFEHETDSARVSRRRPTSQSVGDPSRTSTRRVRVRVTAAPSPGLTQTLVNRAPGRTRPMAGATSIPRDGWGGCTNETPNVLMNVVRTHTSLAGGPNTDELASTNNSEFPLVSAATSLFSMNIPFLWSIQGPRYVFSPRFFPEVSLYFPRRRRGLTVFPRKMHSISIL